MKKDKILDIWLFETNKQTKPYHNSQTRRNYQVSIFNYK